MTDAERDSRWNTAKEHYQAASLCFDHGFHDASVTRSYYAAYQVSGSRWATPRWAAGDIMA
jgi:uncharacterized protein (UPF0332 family)